MDLTGPRIQAPLIHAHGDLYTALYPDLVRVKPITLLNFPDYLFEEWNERGADRKEIVIGLAILHSYIVYYY